MKQRRAAAPYAKALFAVEKEHNQTGLVGRELGHMAATFESDLALRDFDPLTAIAEKYQRLVDETWGACVHTFAPPFARADLKESSVGS